jgi:hypothetical protein
MSLHATLLTWIAGSSCTAAPTPDIRSTTALSESGNSARTNTRDDRGALAATPPPTISIGGLGGLAIYDLDGTRLRQLTTAPAQLSLEIGDGRILYVSKWLDGALELRELDAEGHDRALATLPQLFDPDSCRALIPNEAELEAESEETQWLPWIEISGDMGFGVDLRSGHACLHMRDREAEPRHELVIAIALDTGSVTSQVVRAAASHCPVTSRSPSAPCHEVDRGDVPRAVGSSSASASWDFDYDGKSGSLLGAKGIELARLCRNEKIPDTCLVRHDDSPGGRYTVLTRETEEEDGTYAIPFVLDRSDGRVWTLAHGVEPQVEEIAVDQLAAFARGKKRLDQALVLGPGETLEWVSADRLWVAGVLWRTDEHSCTRLDGTLTRTIVRSGGD